MLPAFKGQPSSRRSEKNSLSVKLCCVTKHLKIWWLENNSFFGSWFCELVTQAELWWDVHPDSAMLTCESVDDLEILAGWAFSCVWGWLAIGKSRIT